MKKKLIFLLSLSLMVIVACKKDKETESVKPYSGISLEEYVSINHPGLEPIDTTGVYVIITEEGDGEYPKVNDELYCYYKGMFLDGTPFDSTKQRPADEDLPDLSELTPYLFYYFENVTSMTHIVGWYVGFGQLKRGSKATFLIPAERAYGSTGKGSIPPNAPLRFDVELINNRR